MLDIECGQRTLSLIVRRDLASQAGRAGVLGRPSVLGVVVTASPEHASFSVSLVVLSRPDGQGALRVVAARLTGERLYSGHGEALSDAVLNVEVAAVRRPGIAPGTIRALVSDQGVEVFGRMGRTAVDPPRVPYRRPEADLKNPGA